MRNPVSHIIRIDVYPIDPDRCLVGICLDFQVLQDLIIETDMEHLLAHTGVYYASGIETEIYELLVLITISL